MPKNRSRAKTKNPKDRVAALLAKAADAQKQFEKQQKEFTETATFAETQQVRFSKV